MTSRPSVIIIGAGHNGLVAGITLAKTGHKVRIFEASHKCGGAVTTDAAACGCKLSSGASVLGAMPIFLRDELGLSEKLTLIEPDPQMSVMLRDRRIIDFYADSEKTENSINAIFGEHGVSDYRHFVADYARAADIYAPFHQKPGRDDELAAALGDLAAPFLHGSLRTLQYHYFRDVALASAVCATTVLYPARCDEHGSAFPLLYLSQNSGTKNAGYAHVKGGMGEIAKALEDKARAEGVSITCGMPVKTIIKKDGGACGVTLADGSSHNADLVLSNLSPSATQALIMGAQQPIPLDPAIYDCGAVKLNLVLNGLPFALEQITQEKEKRFLLCINSHFDDLDETWRAFRLGYTPDKHYAELTMPGSLDPDLCCHADHYPVSIYALYAPYTINEAQKQRDTIGDAILRSIEDYFPGFTQRIVSKEILTPYMLEQRWGMTLGNVDHGNLIPRNRLSRRNEAPVTPGLHICGAGGFPGGLVSGLPGYLTAQKIIAA
jgi:phytoene dehydrogenase-like protein